MELVLCTLASLPQWMGTLPAEPGTSGCLFLRIPVAKVYLERTEANLVMVKKKEETFLFLPQWMHPSNLVPLVLFLEVLVKIHEGFYNFIHLLLRLTISFSWGEWNGSRALWRSHRGQPVASVWVAFHWTAALVVKGNLTFGISVLPVRRSYCLSFGCVCFTILQTV